MSSYAITGNCGDAIMGCSPVHSTISIVTERAPDVRQLLGHIATRVRLLSGRAQLQMPCLRRLRIRQASWQSAQDQAPGADHCGRLLLHQSHRLQPDSHPEIHQGRGGTPSKTRKPQNTSAKNARQPHDRCKKTLPRRENRSSSGFFSGLLERAPRV